MSTSSKAAGLLIAGAAFLALSPSDVAGKQPPGLGDPKKPDLVIESIAIEPWACKAGLPHIKMRATVRNTHSKTPADLSQIPFQQVVKMRVAGQGGKVVSCPNVVDVDPGGPLQLGPGQAWTAEATRCVGPGGYYVWAEADPLKLVPEFNEKNNYKARSLSIQDPCKWAP